jgi:hypothetical protein
MTDGLDRATSAATLTKAEIVSICVLIAGFIAVVAWFAGVDFYHRHFYDTGAIVLADNVVRVVFVGIFSWLVYAAGAGLTAVMVTPHARAALSPAERGVLGFGVGIGVWHVAMLILGILDLYYRATMVALCLVVLVVSARHFARIAVAGWRILAIRLGELRQARASPQTTGAALIVAVAAWLLLRRGLFPGGGSDYYTHYFYYYLAVLKNHGLAPNDVWYQYYYSKGSGLAFLGMLLTDPEAPALTTFPCVICAAVAIMTLGARMMPGSLWPAAGTLVYLLFYLVGLDGGIAEGQFQKDHEETTALVVLFAWALCMERYGPVRPCRIMAAAVAIAMAILSQPVAVLLGFFAGLLSAWSLLRRRWRDMWGYGAIAALTAAVVLAVLVWSDLATGLASDQAFELTLYFADFARLDRWGVIPGVLASLWIRDNYQALIPPLGWGVLKELSQFMRLGVLWPFLAAPLIIAVILRVAASAGRTWTRLQDSSAASAAATTATTLAAMLGLFAVVALVAGRSQNISFARLSTFFIPLAVLFGIAGSAWVMNRLGGPRRDLWLDSALPMVLLVIVVVEWQGQLHWTRRIAAETANALRFFSGQSSLAQAYAHADSGYAFGAINPGALAAARQVPYGTPIWSTNVDSYCMVPGCLIESVVSFKMSGRLDDILGGDPELAKLRLQEAGLDYFLFMKDYPLLDLLPFSRLFAPDTIGRYLGVKWTDGSTYLLTWIGPQSSPLGPDFLEAYGRQRATPDPLRWFRFDALAPAIVAITPRLRSVTQWGAAQQLVTWQNAR